MHSVFIQWRYSDIYKYLFVTKQRCVEDGQFVILEPFNDEICLEDLPSPAHLSVEISMCWMTLRESIK